MEQLAKHHKLRLSQSYSELVAKSLFLCHNLIHEGREEDMPEIPKVLREKESQRSKEVIKFMNDYAVFKRRGLPVRETNDDWTA